MTLTHEGNSRRVGVNSGEAHHTIDPKIDRNIQAGSVDTPDRHAAGAAGLSVVSAAVLPASATCGVMQALLLERPQEACVVVCDSRLRPSGMLMSETFYMQTTAEYEPDHFRDLAIGRIMNPDPLIVDFDTPIDLVRERAKNRSSRTRRDAVIVTRDGQFFGVLQMEQLAE